MDLHKYTDIPSVKGRCGADGCALKVTRRPDAQNSLAFQNNTRASDTDIFGLRAGKASRLCCAGDGAWTQHGSGGPAAGTAVLLPPAASPRCSRGEGTSKTFTHRRSTSQASICPEKSCCAAAVVVFNYQTKNKIKIFLKKFPLESLS